jgi:hypothetical protein
VLQRRQRTAHARRAPELGETLLRLLRSAARESVREQNRIHRPRRGAGNSFELQPPVGEKMIEHAPGEGAMRAAALKREIDQLLRAAGRGRIK